MIFYDPFNLTGISKLQVFTGLSAAADGLLMNMLLLNSPLNAGLGFSGLMGL